MRDARIGRLGDVFKVKALSCYRLGRLSQKYKLTYHPKLVLVVLIVLQQITSVIRQVIIA